MRLLPSQAVRSTLLSLALLLTTLLPAAGTPASASGLLPTLDPDLPLHPLLQLLGTSSGPQVRLIVQKTGPLVSTLSLVQAVGGTLRGDFPLIQAFALDMPAVAVPLLPKLSGVKYVSIDGPVRPLAIDTTDLKTTYESAISVPAVWNGTAGTLAATGAGVSVAVLDTGVNAALPDFGPNLVAVNTNPNATGPQDGYGHGTHVVGTIAGRDPQRRYIGVAPDARVYSVKIADDEGYATESDLLRGLQWVQDNRVKYNLRAVNLSVSTSIPASYMTSPVSAAVEQLWRSGVVVIAASGNAGDAHDATWAAPGNDPFVVTVGALDNNETAAQADDTLAPFSSHGTTQDGVYKPDVVAPGRKIVAPLAGPNVKLAQDLPDRITDGTYIRLSGTSMAAPVTTGVVALLLQRYPTLQPDQVKWLLQNTDRAYAGQTDAAGAVDPVALLKRASAGSVGKANQGLQPAGQGSLLSPITGLLGGLIGLTPDASYWNASYWNASYWNASYWNASYWNASYRNASYWNASTWDASYWN